MFFLELELKNLEFLEAIRHIENINIAIQDEVVWVNGFTKEQIQNPAIIATISFAKKYVLKEEFLFFLNGLLPEKKLPNGLIWKPISEVFSVQLPQLNYNFFGVSEKIRLHLKPSEMERDAIVLLTSKEVFENYILNAPNFRYNQLKWLFFEDKILVYGTPLLPINGQTFWQAEQFLIPTGFELNGISLLPILREIINPERKNYILLQENNYYEIDKQSFQTISISSYRLTNAI